MRRAHALSALITLAASGCALAPSQDSVHVSSLDLNVTVAAADDGAESVVTVTLDSPIGDVHLAGGDALRLDAGGSVHVFTEAQDGRDISYEARFPPADGVYHLKLLRPEDRNIDDLAWTMPPSFSLAVPDAPAAGPIALTWDPGPDDGYAIDVDITGACITPFNRRLSRDAGAYTIDPAELILPNGGTCPLDVTLRRTLATQGEVMVDGGHFTTTAVQRRTAHITWGP